MQNQEHTLNDENQENESAQNEADIKADTSSTTDEKTASDVTGSNDDQLKELNDKYLRLYSEFDNYRKRTIKERSEIIKTAAEDVFKAILPILDDFDRAIKANENVTDAAPVKEGFQLIFNKFKNATQQKGLTAFETKGEVFNPDIMEAITHVPATDEAQKGKVIDEVEKGYKLGDKVIRFAKVVIAQ
jgi:molecular chaperone GrpE